MTIELNPARRLIKLFDQALAQSGVNDQLMAVWMRVFQTKSKPVFYQQWADILATVQALTDFAHTSVIANRIDPLFIEQLDLINRSMPDWMTQHAWREVVGNLGTKPQLAFAAIAPVIGPALADDGWEERVRLKIADARAVLDGVEPSKRDKRWFEAARAVARALEHMDRAWVTGVEAIERAGHELEHVARMPARTEWAKELRIKVIEASNVLWPFVGNVSLIATLLDNRSVALFAAGAAASLLIGGVRPLKQIPSKSSPGNGMDPNAS